jgi:nucleoside-diphosphate-sugar epimerase
MRILITGGTGFLGRATVQALTGAGHQVRAIVRDPVRAAPALAAAGPGVEILTGDPGDPASIGPAMAGMDAVVHGAATFSYDRDAGSVLSTNAALARTVLAAAGHAGVGRVVDVSSLIVFSLAFETVDEGTPLTQAGEIGWSDPYLRSKVEAEFVGRELEAAGLPRITVHPGTIIGPDDAGPGPSGQLLTVLLRGGTIPDARAPWVDVRDCARAIALALDAPVGSRFCLTSGVATHRDTAALLDEVTGCRPRRFFTSDSTTRRLARLNDLAGGRLGALPESGSLDFMLSSARSVDVSRSERALGLAYRPLRETVADAVRWWAANGTIPAKAAGRLAIAAGPAGSPA